MTLFDPDFVARQYGNAADPGTYAPLHAGLSVTRRPR